MTKEMFILIFIVSCVYLSSGNTEDSGELIHQSDSIHKLSKRAPRVHQTAIARGFDTAQSASKGLKMNFLGFRPKKTLHIMNGGNRSSVGEMGLPYDQQDDQQVDIVFVMDNSGSIGNNNFEIEKKFVSSLVENYGVPPPKTRVAVVSYSSHVKLEFNFHQCQSKNAFRQEVAKISYVGRMTATGKALKYVQNRLIFNQTAGARKNVAKVILVLTDGFSNRGVTPSDPATSLKNSEVTIFVVGITQNTNIKELNSIASRPRIKDDKFVYRVGSYTALTKIIKLLKTT